MSSPLELPSIPSIPSMLPMMSSPMQNPLLPIGGIAPMGVIQKPMCGVLNWKRAQDANGEPQDCPPLRKKQCIEEIDLCSSDSENSTESSDDISTIPSSSRFKNNGPREQTRNGSKMHKVKPQWRDRVGSSRIDDFSCESFSHSYDSHSPSYYPHSPTYTSSSPAYDPHNPPYNPPSPTYNSPSPSCNPSSPAYDPHNPPYNPPSPTYNSPSPSCNPSSPAYDPHNPPYNPPSPTDNPPSPAYNSPSPAYNSPSPSCNPSSPAYDSPTPKYDPLSPGYNSPSPSCDPSSPAYDSPSPKDDPLSPGYDSPSPSCDPSSPAYDSPTPKYDPLSPGYDSCYSPCSSSTTTEVPTYDVPSPTCNFSSPPYVPLSPPYYLPSPEYDPPSPGYDSSSPEYSPTSPAYDSCYSPCSSSSFTEGHSPTYEPAFSFASSNRISFLRYESTTSSNGVPSSTYSPTAALYHHSPPGLSDSQNFPADSSSAPQQFHSNSRSIISDFQNNDDVCERPTMDGLVKMSRVHAQSDSTLSEDFNANVETSMVSGLTQQASERALAVMQKHLKESKAITPAFVKFCESIVELKKKTLRIQPADDRNKASTSTNTTGNSEDPKENLLCKICMDQEKAIVFLPCGHLLSCLKCAEKIKQCPLCRANITNTVRAYLS